MWGVGLEMHPLTRAIYTIAVYYQLVGITGLPAHSSYTATSYYVVHCCTPTTSSPAMQHTST